MANNSVKEIICYLAERSTSSRPKRLNEIERKKTEEATTFAITHALKIPKKLADRFPHCKRIFVAEFVWDRSFQEIFFLH